MPETGSGSGARALRMVILVVVLGGAVIAAAFYQEWIAGYLTQEGWNPGAPEALVREFIRLSHDPKGGDAAAKLLAAGTYDPVVRNGRLTELLQGGGMVRKRVRDFAPTADARQLRAELRVKEGGGHRVLVEFGNGKWGEFRVARRNGVRRITDIPSSLLDAEPTVRNPEDY